MQSNWDTCFAHVIRSEGGYVNHVSDPGGMTNLGVTKTVWEEWVDRAVTEAEMRALTPMLVEPLYRAKYWDRVKGDDLPEGVDYCVFDAAVNSGVRRAAQWLQTIIGAVPDGAIGPKTLASVMAKPTKDLIQEYSAQRLAFLKSLSTWKTFGKGWERRVKKVEETALSM